MNAHGHVDPEVLSALVDGECGPDERRHAHAHLVHCDDCRQRMSEISTVQSLVSGLPLIAAPEDLVCAVLAPQRAKVIDLSRGRRRYAAAAAAAVFAAVTLGGLAAPAEQERPPVDVLMTRHVSVNSGVVGGEVLFAVTGR
ncbi:MAG TPA: zf-HC2 domain-containing protein [Actinomycetota bacterium]|nr:zf-HC2 domain-containing protein [Actinomycetota bacterium]